MTTSSLKLFRELADAVPHSKAMGIRLVDVSEQKVTLSMLPQSFMVGEPESGTLITGAVYSLIDSACGVAVFNVLRIVQPIATLDLRIDDYRPARMDEGELLCEAYCSRVTRDVAFLEANVWQQRRDNQIASGRGVFALGTTRGEAKHISGLDPKLRERVP